MSWTKESKEDEEDVLEEMQGRIRGVKETECERAMGVLERGRGEEDSKGREEKREMDEGRGSGG